MGTEACVVKEQNLSGDSISISGPLTPESNRENGEQEHELSSPLTAISSPLTANCPTSPDGNIVETPKVTLFDSFAPGPNNLMLAPYHSKYREESRIHVVRRLNFTCETNLISHESNIGTTSDDEDHLFKIVYATILDAIVAEQTKQVGANFPTCVSGLDRFSTPTKSAPHLTGIAETCPGPPVKSSSKCRDIDKEVCKKLEF